MSPRDIAARRASRVFVRARCRQPSSFSAIAISETEQWAELSLIAAGLFIRCVWLYVTVEGWAVVHLHVQIAGKAEAAWFRTLPNPFSPAIYGKAQVTIYRLMLIVIAVFILMYLGLGALRLI